MNKWQDEITRIYTYHKGKVEEHGGYNRPGRPRRNEKGWSLRDTARELNLSVGAVSEAITISVATNFFAHLLDIKERYKVLEEIDNLSVEITELKNLAQHIEDLHKEFLENDAHMFSDSKGEADRIWGMIDIYLSKLGTRLITGIKDDIREQ